jgi:hypothetical protein
MPTIIKTDANRNDEKYQIGMKLTWLLESKPFFNHNLFYAEFIISHCSDSGHRLDPRVFRV